MVLRPLREAPCTWARCGQGLPRARDARNSWSLEWRCPLPLEKYQRKLDPETRSFLLPSSLLSLPPFGGT